MHSDKNLENTSLATIFNKVSIRSVIEVFFFVILVVLFLKSFVLEFYRVQSGSMEPEFYKGDIVLVSRLAYFIGFPTRFPIISSVFGSNVRIDYASPKLGEIVVIDASESLNIPESNYIIKRVVGVPGDSMFVKITPNGIRTFNLKKNAVYNYGSVITIPKSGDVIDLDIMNLSNFYDLLVNEGIEAKAIIDSIKNNPLYVHKYRFRYSYCFVQGDNSENSEDSRSFGLIPDKAIIGRAIMLLMPSDKHINKSVRLLIP